MTHTESILLEMLKATTLALRITIGHIEAPYMKTAHAMVTEVITDEQFRKLSGDIRAALADSGTAVMEASRIVKGLK